MQDVDVTINLENLGFSRNQQTYQILGHPEKILRPWATSPESALECVITRARARARASTNVCPLNKSRRTA